MPHINIFHSILLQEIRGNTTQPPKSTNFFWSQNSSDIELRTVGSYVIYLKNKKKIKPTQMHIYRKISNSFHTTEKK